MGICLPLHSPKNVRYWHEKHKKHIEPNFLNVLRARMEREHADSEAEEQWTSEQEDQL